MSFYVADVSGYVMTGPPVVYQCLRVASVGILNECIYTYVLHV